MSAPDPNLLGQLLIADNLINQADLDKALAYQQQLRGRLGAILVRLGALSEDSLLPVLARQTGMSLLEEADLPQRGEEVRAVIQFGGLSADWCASQGLVLWEAADGTIHCACRDPLSSYLQETLVAALPERSLAWHFIRAQDLERLIREMQRQDDRDPSDIAHLRELAEEAPIVELVNNTLAQAIGERASDIHVEPEENAFQIRFRVDGVLQTRATHLRDRFDAVASRIKLVSGMDIAERRVPQDGRISIRASGVEMDIRVSAVPGIHGESIVMRLLPKERADLRLDILGMAPDHHARFAARIEEPNGIILVTGPTGSGKSTTLYAALDATNDQTKKIITVEDPVEYKMRGITQIQTHSEIGYSFARALRAILRQDPDVIMIGEIRDLETAEIAIQAALTGHMVLSTLHTNDAPSAFTRLIDMGVEPFLIVSSVRAIQAQRLVRKLCSACARPSQASPLVAGSVAELRQRFPQLFAAEAMWREPGGCRVCQGTGYRGRLGVYEFMDVSPELQAAVMRQASVAELIAIAREQGYRTLREDGLIKAWHGQTSIEEVLRVTGLGDGSA